jgi:hypothetical protein
MGKKRVTDLQRTISFGMNADELTLRTAVETLTAILGEKFKKTPVTKKPVVGKKAPVVPVTHVEGKDVSA